MSEKIIDFNAFKAKKEAEIADSKEMKSLLEKGLDRNLEDEEQKAIDNYAKKSSSNDEFREAMDICMYLLDEAIKKNGGSGGGLTISEAVAELKKLLNKSQ